VRLRRAIWVSVGTALLLGTLSAQTPESSAARIREWIASGDLNRAGTAATQALEKWPKTSEFPHLRGLVYFRLNQFERAEKDLLAAKRLAPADPDIAFDLGLLSMQMQQYDRAAKELELAMKEPERQRAAMPHILLGRAYQNSNRSELAIEQFKTALRLDPKVKLGHYHLGYALESVGDAKSARAEYERELAQTQDSAEVFYRHGKLLHEAGEFAAAEKSLRRSLELDLRSGDSNYALGKCLATEGKNAEAAAVLRRAIELNPNDASAYFQLSRVLTKLGDREGARAATVKFKQLKTQEKATGGMATGRVR
jgi:Flp pilus assembly protein TadD